MLLTKWGYVSFKKNTVAPQYTYVLKYKSPWHTVSNVLLFLPTFRYEELKSRDKNASNKGEVDSDNNNSSKASAADMDNESSGCGPFSQPSSLIGAMAAQTNEQQEVLALKKALEWELSLDSRDLRSHAWYHGPLPRQRAEEIVQREGDFLIRDCTSQPDNYVLTCRTKTSVLHFVINKVSEFQWSYLCPIKRWMLWKVEF